MSDKYTKPCEKSFEIYPLKELLSKFSKDEETILNIMSHSWNFEKELFPVCDICDVNLNIYFIYRSDKKYYEIICKETCGHILVKNMLL